MARGESEIVYLDLEDFLLLAEAATGQPAEGLARMPDVISRAGSALSVPSASYAGASSSIHRIPKSTTARFTTIRKGVWGP